MPRFLAVLLFAALLLSPITASARTQIVLPSDSSLKWHTIRFCYADPGDALTLMNYGNGPGATDLLPSGIARIFVVPHRNSLLVNATEDGFDRFTARLFQVLGSVPQQVRLKVLVAAIPVSRKINIDLSTASEALNELQEAHAVFWQKTVSAAGNTPITLTFDCQPLNASRSENRAGQMASGSGPALPTLFVTPQLTGKNYVSMSAELMLPTTTGVPKIILGWIPIGTDMSEPLGQPSGQMIFFDVTSHFTPAPNKIYLFLTPTILPPSPDDGSGITIDP